MTSVSDDWQEARLIPTSGIKGSEEQEKRATSALLAVMRSVNEFGESITRDLGSPKGDVEAYIEVPFEVGDRTLYPDGLVRVSRGKREWTVLLEVKTGKNELDAAQVEAYLDIAKEHKFDAVLTISNQVPPSPGVHPTKVDKRKIRTVALHHWSWTRVLAEAVMQREHRGVSDPVQAWILGELVRYLEHPKSGAMEFDDMGAHWVPVRDAVSAGTLRASDMGVVDIVTRFDALMRYVGLQLGRRLGAEVQEVIPRKEQADRELRVQRFVSELTQLGRLSGALKIPNTVGPLRVVADIRANQVICEVDVGAPETARAKSRVTWLLRQLKNAPEDVSLEAFVAHQRGPGAADLLRNLRDKPELLVLDPAKELKSFTVSRAHKMGVKRSVGRGGFITSVIDAVDIFYAEVLQNLRVWSPPAPKLSKPPELNEEPSPTVTPSPVSASGATLIALGPVSREP